MKRIYAENIKSGGGKVLLDMLIRQNATSGYKFYLNEHFKCDCVSNDSVITVKDKVIWRIMTKVCLHGNSEFELHFGNLPPIVTNSKQTSVYMHNALHFVPLSSLFREKPRLLVRLLLERVYIRLFMTRNYTICVQTKYMMDLVRVVFPRNEVKLVKFYPNNVLDNNNPEPCTRDEFKVVFVGGTEIYKNLSNVLQAIELFVKNNPKELTLHVVGYISEQTEEKPLSYKIVYHNSIAHQESLAIIKSCDLMIFASEFESFGMPLWEAGQLGTDIIASDCSYVFENCLPKACFNPRDVGSIYRALCIYFRAQAVVVPDSNAEF